MKFISSTLSLSTFPRDMRRSGFTLVELAIVLVIIGLLIGGILVAQSMIKSVKMKGIISQLQQIDIATAHFFSTYKQLPGDSNLFPIPGNNNGQIIGGCCGSSEGDIFFNHLSLGVGLKSIKNKDYQAYWNDKPLFYNQSFYDRPCNEWETSMIEYVDRGGGQGSKNYFRGLCPMPDEDILYLDRKLDDGNWVTGKIIGPTFVGTGWPDRRRMFTIELGAFTDGTGN